MQLEKLAIDKEGAQLFNAALSVADLGDLETSLADTPRDRAGVRLHGIPELRPVLAHSGVIGKTAASVLGENVFAVRAILFDKNADANWAVAWHQDRTIAVQQRIDVSGFGPWSVKSGMVHVEPPFELLARMVTLRVHLDPVPKTNAPLLIAPGSHNLRRIPESSVLEVVEHCGIIECLAEAGDIWMYSTPILHSSEAAVVPGHRRVLQVDYAVGQLPGGLQWLGV